MVWIWTGPESLAESWIDPHATASYGHELAGEDPWAQFEEDWLDDAAMLFAALLGVA